VFFVTYVRRELRRRMRQAIFIAMGLALGVGLVVTVAAASAGVSKAQAKALGALYGLGTDVTVTGPAPGPAPRGSKPPQRLEIVAGHAEICTPSGKCTSAAGKTINSVSAATLPISASEVAAVARLHGVAAAAGGITIQESSLTFPQSGVFAPQSSSVTVGGVDTAMPSVGPLGAALLTSGRSFTAADSDDDVAVVDSGYATSSNLKVGSVLTIDGVKLTAIGIVRQPQASSPPDVYVPLQVAQAMPTSPLTAKELKDDVTGSQNDYLKDEVTDIYVVASSATGIPAVTTEVSALLPNAIVTSDASLASEITGSVASATKLANDLGKWLSVLVLIAAFAVACLLTMAAVARRVAEFGTLKALGWRSRRIVAQVLGESAVMGGTGAAVGVGLRFAAVAIIAAVAPKLSATVPTSVTLPSSSARSFQQTTNGHTSGFGTLTRVVSVPMHPAVTAGVIVLAVILAMAGALLAGSLGSWRIARLRPADALSRVA
jgi:putative ABC transport system permease protein